MSTESEIRSDILENKFAPMSPSIQSDLSTDGDGSTNQTNSLSNDKFPPVAVTSDTNEPKAKKRRKQSNPLKIQNAASPKMDIPADDVEFEKFDFEEAKAIQDASFESELLNSINDKNKSVEFVSQKNALSRVTNALFNNKIREANQATKLANKSKESSLQSLTDISSPESSDEMISNNENKTTNIVQNQNAYPQMPPLLPITAAADLANEGKLLIPYSFADFPSPLQQGNVSLTMSNRSFITSSGVRVFNPEAYCELCEKEFCNKYFLKTHKANKHGICSVDNNSGSYSYRAPYKSMQMNPQIAQQMISQMCENGATFGSADSYCNICQKYFCNKYFLKKHRQNIHGIQENQESSPSVPSSIHVPVISSPLPVTRPQSLEPKIEENASNNIPKDDDLNVSLENIKNSINGTFAAFNGSSPIIPSKTKNTFLNISKEKKTEKYLCELCNIEFCDKSFLDSHRQNKHGMTKAPVSDFVDFSEVGKVESIDKSDDSDELKEGFKGQMCAPCMKNFTSADAFQNHMLEVHGAMIKDEDENSRASESVRKNGQNHFEKEMRSGEINLHYPHSLKKSPIMQDMENSNGSNDSGFICNVCFAKYKDKSSLIFHIENEHNLQDSTALLKETELQCDACPEQFSDRLLLMSHRLKVHGIISPGFSMQNESVENDILRRMDGEYAFYLGSRQKSPSNFCQICNKELCNKYFMKTHMLKMHGIDMDKVPVERSPSGTSGVYCDICQKFLCSKYFLKVHKQNVHGIFDDSTKLPNSPSSFNSLGINEKKLSGNYSQLMKLNNTLMNETGINKDDVMKRNNSVFPCDICGQEFLSKLQLQVHLVNKHVKCNESKSVPSVIAGAYSQMMEESKETAKSGILPCSCCSYVTTSDDATGSGKSFQNELRMVSCLICNMSYHHSDYYTHHLSHGSMIMPRKKSSDNGSDEQSSSNHISSHDLGGTNKKFKRFRCSKCDKTFRTRVKCLHHIQVMHKSKKGLTNHVGQKISVDSLGNKKPVCMENGLGIIHPKGMLEDSGVSSNPEFQQPSMPVPYVLPKNSDVIMQPFHLSEPKPEGTTKQDMFVPSLVYLPVSQKISEPVTVAFTLTPA